MAGNDLVLQEESAVRDAYMQEELEIRSDDPTFVPPKFIYTPPKNELLIKASTPELSFVSPKYIATSPDNIHQKLGDDKTSINSIASISHRGSKYTLSLNDLIDCYYNYLVGKQAVVRSEQRSRTIYGKRMPRILRLRLKHCLLDSKATRYKALKLCQRIIFQRLNVHNGNRRKSIIQSISRKMNTDPIRQSSIEMNEGASYSIPQDIQHLMLQRKSIHNELRHKFIQSISRKMTTDPIPNLSSNSLTLTPSKESCLVVHPSANASILQDYMLYPVPNYSDYSFSSSPSLGPTSVKIHTLEIEHGLGESKLMLDCQDIHMDDLELGATTRYVVMDDVATLSFIQCFAPLTMHHNVSGRMTAVIALTLLGIMVIYMHFIRILNH